MSLDVYLNCETPAPKASGSGIFIRRDGATVEISRAEWDRLYPGREPVFYLPGETETTLVYRANITHNLTDMAAAVGLYEPLWRPDEIGIERAAQLIEPLAAGLVQLHAQADACRRLNPSNGWGTYEGLVGFVSDYLKACILNPEAKVSVWR